MDDEQVNHIETMLTDLKEDLREIKKEIKEVRESLHDPTDGVFSKIQKLDSEVQNHKKVFSAFSKFFWIVITALASTVVGIVVTMF